MGGGGAQTLDCGVGGSTPRWCPCWRHWMCPSTFFPAIPLMTIWQKCSDAPTRLWIRRLLPSKQACMLCKFKILAGLWECFYQKGNIFDMFVSTSREAWIQWDVVNECRRQLLLLTGFYLGGVWKVKTQNGWFSRRTSGNRLALHIRR